MVIVLEAQVKKGYAFKKNKSFINDANKIYLTKITTHISIFTIFTELYQTAD